MRVLPISFVSSAIIALLASWPAVAGAIKQPVVPRLADWGWSENPVMQKRAIWALGRFHSDGRNPDTAATNASGPVSRVHRPTSGRSRSRPRQGVSSRNCQKKTFILID